MKHFWKIILMTVLLAALLGLCTGALAEGSNLAAYVDGVEYDTDSYDFFLSPGKPVPMKVRVSADDMAGITYEWQYAELDAATGIWSELQTVDGANSDTWTLERLTRRVTYYCTVSDAYGNSTTVQFHLFVDNHFNAWAEENEWGYRIHETSINMDLGGSAELRAFAEADDPTGMTYRWERHALDAATGSWTELEVLEDAGDTLTVDNIQARLQYYCTVTDAYGSSVMLQYDLYVENHLDVWLIDENGNRNDGATICGAPGEIVTLTAYVSADDEEGLVYTWRRQELVDYGDYQTFEYVPLDHHGRQLTVEIPSAEPQEYQFEAMDRFGTTLCVYFSTKADNHLTASVAEGWSSGYTAMFVAPGEPFTLKAWVSADDMTVVTMHEWAVQEYDSDTGWSEWQTIDGTNSDTLTVDGVYRQSKYYFTAEDPYGGFVRVYFEILIDNQLHAYVDGPDYDTQRWTIASEPGKPVTMKVRVSATVLTGVTYEWGYRYPDPVYGWIGEFQIVAGATECEYTLDSLTETVEYVCAVRDAYGNVDSVIFGLSVDNPMEISASGTMVDTGREIYYNVNTIPGSPAELTVNATCQYGTLSYQWYIGSPYGTRTEISGATGPSLPLEAVTASKTYCCRVSDEYGNTRWVRFEVVADNQLTARAVKGPTFVKAPEETVTLEVAASCLQGEPHFQWCCWSGWNRTYVPIEGATGSSYTTEPLSAEKEYCCTVTDDYGNEKNIYFHVQIDNHLTARAAGASSFQAEEGESVTMEVIAQCLKGSISYQWYRLTGPRTKTAISGATSAVYAGEAGSTQTIYICSVWDEYGDSLDVRFSIVTREANTWGETTWRIEDGHKLIISGNGPISDFYQYSVSAWLAHRDQITEVEIQNGVTAIGAYAFDHFTALQSVQIPNSVTRIGERAFNGCSSLPALHIPQPVTSILPAAFAGCDNLTLTLASDNHAYWMPDENFLITSDGYTLVEYVGHGTSAAVPSPVKHVSSYAFADCLTLVSVTLPEGAESIRFHAFENCENLREVHLPKSFSAIGPDAFPGCQSLTDIWYAGTEAEWNANVTIDAQNDALRNVTIHFGEEQQGSNILVLPANLTKIESEAFRGLTDVDAVEIPASVTSIADDAFDPGMSLMFLNEDHPLIPWAREHGYNVVIPIGE